jgi:hypothetical protein
MRYDVLLNKKLRQDLHELAEKMQARETKPVLGEDERSRILQNLTLFKHTTGLRDFSIGGVDGTGDYPALAYEDSFVYFTLAQGTIYRTDPLCGLKEVGPEQEPVFAFALVPEEEKARRDMLDECFENLAGLPLDEVIKSSDYRKLKKVQTGSEDSVSILRENLIRPHASDSANLGVQFRSTGELGTALRLIQSENCPDYLFIDGTLSLPFVGRKELSLFFEHLKRLCCVEARKRDCGFFALSKSHGIPSINLLEELAAQKAGFSEKQQTEHWFLRFPVKGKDGWEFSLTEGRMIPPVGTISYLVRFHRKSPVYRLDMDQVYWEEKIRGETKEQTLRNEVRLFEDLDYSCHEQRCFGYPYPIKAAHDRASLTKPEREALRKQIIDAAVAAGMKRSLFRDVSMMTGHN